MTDPASGDRYRCERCIELEKIWPQEQKIQRAGFPFTMTRSELRCGFNTEGIFSAANWSCGTLIALRRAVDESERTAWIDDQHFAMLPFECDPVAGLPTMGAICLTWYKHRGRTDNACVLLDSPNQYSDVQSSFLTLQIAEAVLRQHETREGKVRPSRICYWTLDVPSVQPLLEWLDIANDVVLARHHLHKNCDRACPYSDDELVPLSGEERRELIAEFLLGRAQQIRG